MNGNFSCSQKEIQTDLFEHCFTITLSAGEIYTLWNTDAINSCGTFVLSTTSENRVDVYVNDQLIDNIFPDTQDKRSVTADPLNKIQVRFEGLQSETFTVTIKVMVHYECC